MIRHTMMMLIVAGGLALAACATAGDPAASPAAPTAAVALPGPTTANETPTPQPTPVIVSDAPAPDATATSTSEVAAAVATRVGSEYVLRLPREDAVPAGWLMNPLPTFETRAPGPDDTYRFACLELPARSTGVASVGYRHLEGLPSVGIEYVVYASADDAAAALDDMRAATETCADFTIGPDAATAAAFAPLEFPAHGDESFAAVLSTRNDATGDLLTHVIKIRHGHVVIGISHSQDAAADPPDATLTNALAETAVANLAAVAP